MKVEFLKAYDDGTWDTEIIDIPEKVFSGFQSVPLGSPGWKTIVMNWAETKLAQQTQYRNVVLWAIYNEKPEDDDERV